MSEDRRGVQREGGSDWSEETDQCVRVIGRKLDLMGRYGSIYRAEICGQSWYRRDQNFVFEDMMLG